MTSSPSTRTLGESFDIVYLDNSPSLLNIPELASLSSSGTVYVGAMTSEAASMWTTHAEVAGWVVDVSAQSCDGASVLCL